MSVIIVYFLFLRNPQFHVLTLLKKKLKLNVKNNFPPLFTLCSHIYRLCVFKKWLEYCSYNYDSQDTNLFSVSLVTSPFWTSLSIASQPSTLSSHAQQTVSLTSLWFLLLSYFCFSCSSPDPDHRLTWPLWVIHFYYFNKTLCNIYNHLFSQVAPSFPP